MDAYLKAPCPTGRGRPATVTSMKLGLRRPLR